MSTKDERVKGIQQVFKLAQSLGQDVYCGVESFNVCIELLELKVKRNLFYMYLSHGDIEIILCPELGSKNFFTCNSTCFVPIFVDRVYTDGDMQITVH